MIQYPRTIQPILENTLFKGKIIVLYGARQVGKTTLVKAIQSKYAADALYLNCDEPDIRNALSEKIPPNYALSWAVKPSSSSMKPSASKISAYLSNYW